MESQTDRTAQYLRDAIVAGDLRPSHLLVAADIAATLGVSRTPVREALQRLLQEGYATKLDNGFCVVADHPDSEMKDSLEVTAALLELAVRLVCERGSKESLAAMDAAHRGMEEALAQARLAEWTTAAQGWVNALVAASGNTVLTSVMDTLKVHYWRQRWARFLSLADCAEVTQKYRRVSDALHQRDVDDALEAVRDLGRKVSSHASVWSDERGDGVDLREQELPAR